MPGRYHLIWASVLYSQKTLLTSRPCITDMFCAKTLCKFKTNIQNEKTSGSKECRITNWSLARGERKDRETSKISCRVWGEKKNKQPTTPRKQRLHLSWWMLCLHYICTSHSKLLPRCFSNYTVHWYSPSHNSACCEHFYRQVVTVKIYA